MIRYIAIGLMLCGGIGILASIVFPNFGIHEREGSQKNEESLSDNKRDQSVFSIEPTEEDTVLRVLIGGNISGQNGLGIPRFSVKTQKQFMHADAFLANSTALFRDYDISLDSFRNQKNSIPKDHLQSLKDLSLSHLFFLESRLFLFGSFPFQLSQGYADSFGITPLGSDSDPLVIQEYENQFCIIALHAVRDTEVSIREKIKSLPHGVPCFAVVDFGTSEHFEPTRSMRMFAKQLIQWGMDGVIGVGQQAIFPVEIFDSKPIVYSLGDMIGGADSVGVLAEIVVEQREVRLFLHPVQTDDAEQEIRIFSGAEASLFLDAKVLSTLEEVFVVKDF